MSDWFSPDTTVVASTVGGLLIGLSAAVLLHGSGEVLAFTSCIGSLCDFDFPSPLKVVKDPENGWKFGFLASFLLTCEWWIANSESVIFDEAIMIPYWVTGLSGIMAGFGTKMANGCTSGHGISGLGRLSLRSLVAVCTFMGTAFLSASLSSPAFPLIYQRTTIIEEDKYHFPCHAARSVGKALTLSMVLLAIYSITWQLRSSKNGAEATPLVAGDGKQQQQDSPPATFRTFLGKFAAAMVAGPIFVSGLSIGGMNKPSKIVGFFDLTGFSRGTYDPSLAFLFASGILVSLIGYQFVEAQGIAKMDSITPVKRRSSVSGEFHIPKKSAIDSKLVVGSAIFGISMGISGYCPTPCMIMAISGFSDLLFLW
eukprot:CAMPEP_0117032132 /NCGR_PEP_ID=MMETSP0472-20121206/23053_1 /TAXON_ID=693140 ORGANISM="Tiarina fusus, Strain LIS" /NCGR_SAMPLE_ID=MMETSP0472 /ASSEMBLY_ACC=CAM_ASM_000603 /LENGTH=368 /DNA_ID=CAMNT_0004740677 /DNA_START=84 /DNA_END=1187 /DNA_ORIENTATION=+